MTEQSQTTSGRIVELTVENVKRIRAVRITPDGSLVVIAGGNGQGKSSVLDAMEMVLSGGRAIPEQPLRIGERRGYVIADLGGLVVKRTFRANGSSALEVRDAENRIVERPQKMLDALLGSLAFDPMAFMSMNARDQADELRHMVGLDLSDFEKRRDTAYADRTEMNRDVARLKAIDDGATPCTADPDAEEQSMIDLVGKRDALAQARRTANVNRETIEELGRLAVNDLKTIEQIREKMATRAKAFKVMQDNLSSLPDPSQDEIGEVSKKIETCEESNREILRARAIRINKRQMEDAMNASDDLTDTIGSIDEERRKAIADADMPIDGLAFDQDGSVTYGGILLSQASGAEQIRVSMAIGLAGHRELNIMRIKNGNDLDRDSLALVAQLAEDAGAQVWIERIDTTDTPWVIEDGELEAKAIEEQDGDEIVVHRPSPSDVVITPDSQDGAPLGPGTVIQVEDPTDDEPVLSQDPRAIVIKTEDGDQVWVEKDEENELGSREADDDMGDR